MGDRTWVPYSYSTYVLFPWGVLFKSTLFIIIVFMSKANGSETKYAVSLICLTKVIPGSFFNMHLYLQKAFNIT